MKYIRTKNCVYEEEKVNLIADAITGEIFVEKMIDGYTSHLEQVISQADTIDELCDEAVFFDNDNVPHYKSKEGELWYLGASLFSTSLRFGIWTEWGLKYVAKMNDKGELCLI